MEWTEIIMKVPSAQLEQAADMAQMAVDGGIYVEDYSHLEEEAREIAHIDLIDEELLAKDREHGLVRVTACRREGTVQITVEDNGCGMDEALLAQLRDRLARKEYAGEQGEHIGLVNVSHRLRYMYGDRARLLLESQVNAYTRVTVELPQETEQIEEETDEDSDCGR